MSILRFTDMKWGNGGVVVNSDWVGAVTRNENGVTTLHTSAGELYVLEGQEKVVEMMGWGTQAAPAQQGAPSSAAAAASKKP